MPLTRPCTACGAATADSHDVVVFSLTLAFTLTLTSSDRLYSYILSFERLASLRHVCACSSVQSPLLALTFSHLVQYTGQFYRIKNHYRCLMVQLGLNCILEIGQKCVTAGRLTARLHPSRIKLWVVCCVCLLSLFLRRHNLRLALPHAMSR